MVNVEDDEHSYDSIEEGSSECPELYTIVDEQLDKFKSRFKKD